MGRGLTAIVVPEWGARWVARMLHEWDCPGPVIGLAGGQECFVFLAECDGWIPDPDSFRAAVLVGGHQCVPVPPGDGVRWVLRPEATYRWLPSFRALGQAVLQWEHCAERVSPLVVRGLDPQPATG
jgi:hypothetical protein